VRAPVGIIEDKGIGVLKAADLGVEKSDIYVSTEYYC
jgi:hypothetical protein